MNKIKFSHHYQKLIKIDNIEPVTLIQSFYTKTSLLNPEFLEYDTVYWEAGEKKHYLLDMDMPVILLMFVDSNGTLFTTIRRQTPKKEKYYREKMGEDFIIEYIYK